MKITIEISAWHDEDGRLRVDAIGKDLGSTGSGVTDVFDKDYNPARCYMSEQAEFIERLYRYVIDFTKCCNDGRTPPPFPKAAKTFRQKDEE